MPLLFTGHLVKRFGVLPMMAVGVLLNGVCIAVALSGVELTQFLIALFMLGVGWNFLFVGATTLLTTAYRTEERIKTQGAMDFCVFTTMALTSFASGALVTTSGWDWLNRGSIPPLLAIAVALWWFGAARRRAGAVVTA
jgi:MFS family permease